MQVRWDRVFALRPVVSLRPERIAHPNVDVADRKARQYPGWPRTIRQQDNYGRAAAAYLPTLKVSRMKDPVVQVIDQADGEIVYTLRIKGSSFRPKVFRAGKYTIKVGEQETGEIKTLRDVESLPAGERETLKVGF